MHACAGSYFNRGKILGMLGRDAAAQEAYREAAQAAQGVAAGSFSKSLTALQEYGSGEVAALEDALLYLRLSAGAGICRGSTSMVPWYAASRT